MLRKMPINTKFKKVYRQENAGAATGMKYLKFWEEENVKIVDFQMKGHWL